MDCCLCGPMVHIYRPPRNSICMSCFEGAREILELSQRLESPAQVNSECVETPKREQNDAKSHRGTAAKIAEQKGLADAFKQIKQLKHTEAMASKKIEYLESLAVAFREGLHSDVELVTEDGLSVYAHRVVMSTKSSVFRAMFEIDSCKEPDNGIIRIPELSHKQLKYLVEFMYTGHLPAEAMQEHAPALLLAADKYDIPLLIEICEAHIVATINTSNALEVLELATISSAADMKDIAMSTILRNYETIVFSQAYEDFAMKNPLLGVQLTKSFMQELKTHSTARVCSA